MKRYILALDQGTTSSRAILFDREQRIVGSAQREFTQLYPQPGWVEHDAMEIYAGVQGVLAEVLAKCGVSADELAAVGIANQRETTVVWEKATGRPIHNAIVWQCRRTAPLCEELLADKALAESIRHKTGLAVDAYFSATKLRWLLDNVPGARKRAEAGELLFGTIDTWLLYKLSGGACHRTDRTNASRTMLYNIRTLRWDEELCAALDIPLCMLPEVCPSSAPLGFVRLDGVEIPITGCAGDQQAALFGQLCLSPGEAKNTYGTGCFLLMNTGEKLPESRHGLLATLAATGADSVQYALEGSIFVGGAVIQWLRDELRLISSAAESEACARRLADNGGVYLVPAFTGLGAPHWDMYARGAIYGLTRGAGRDHLVRAGLEAIAYQTRDVLDAMTKDTGIAPRSLRVDGGAAANDFLMQFQADILGCALHRPAVLETTALGAACLAGLATGFWENTEALRSARLPHALFSPSMPAAERARLLSGWEQAVRRTLGR